MGSAFSLCQRVAERIAFCGPTSSYEFLEDEAGNLVVEFTESANVTDDWKEVVLPYLIQSESGNELAVAAMIPENPRFTLVFSHSKGMDLGTCVNHLGSFFVGELNAGVVIWDPASYGESRGEATEEKLKQDASAIMRFVRDELKVALDHVVCAGESLGSVAAIHQAANFHPAGLLLLGAFTDFTRKVCGPCCHFGCLACFDNRKAISTVDLPTMIVQGKRDAMFSTNHGVGLRAASPAVVKELLLLDGVTHMACLQQPKFKERFLYFVEHHLYL